LHFEDNLTAERPTFVTHLECALTGEYHAADEVHNLSRAGKPLLVRYDLTGVAKALSKEVLARRAPDLWRYRELLPVRRAQDIVSLGEAMTRCRPARGSRPDSAGLNFWSRTKTAADRLVQGPRPRDGGLYGQGLRHHTWRCDQRNGGRSARSLCHPHRIKTTIFCPQDTPEVNSARSRCRARRFYRVTA